MARSKKYNNIILSFFLTKNKKEAITAIFLLALLVITCSMYVDSERTVYYWDYEGYWGISRQITDLLKHDAVELPGAIFHSLRHDDYNLLPAVPPGAVMWLLGSDSRAAYILALVVLYVFPTIFLYLVVFLRFFKDHTTQCTPSVFLLIAVGTLLWFPLFGHTFLLGLLGIGGVWIALFILYLHFHVPHEQKDRAHWVFLGLALLLLIMFRRWYAYWCVGFMVAFLGESLLRALNQNRRGFSAAAKAMEPFVITALSAGLFMSIFFWPRVEAMLLVDYGDLYSAYRGTDILPIRLWRMGLRFGLLPLLLTMASLVVMLISKKLRPVGLFLSIQCIVIVTLFFRVQDPSLQHYLLLAPAFAIILASGTCLVVININKYLYMQMSAAVIYLIVGIIITLSVFDKRIYPFRNQIKTILPNFTAYPQKRKDFEEIYRMKVYIDEIVNNNPMARIYVVSSSTLFNPDHLLKFEISTGFSFKGSSNISWGAHVDKRDHINNDLFNSEYVLVASPTQYHLNPKGQLVIGLPAEALAKGYNIGRAFKRLPVEFSLANGVKVYFYRKYRPIQSDELNEFISLFKDAYPDNPEIYSAY